MKQQKKNEKRLNSNSLLNYDMQFFLCWASILCAICACAVHSRGVHMHMADSYVAFDLITSLGTDSLGHNTLSHSRARSCCFDSLSLSLSLFVHGRYSQAYKIKLELGK